MRGVAPLVTWMAKTTHRARLLRSLSVASGYVRRTPGFQVLTYHRVNDADDPFFEAMPTATFERQAAWLARTCCVMTVEDLADRVRRGRVPRNAVAITFDDGYRDNLTHAAPILTRYGLPATVFVTTGFIGTGDVPWFDRVACAIKETAAPELVLPTGERLALGDTAARLRALHHTLGVLKREPDRMMRAIADDLVDGLGVDPASRLRGQMLTWDEVRALRALGFAIGAHTVTHPILSRLDDDARAWQEIAGSRRAIERALGEAPRAFAYPNGRSADYGARDRDLVVRAGFTCAVTTRFGVNTADTDAWELRRGGPWEQDLPTFALKLAGYRLAAVTEG